MDGVPRNYDEVSSLISMWTNDHYPEIQCARATKGLEEQEVAGDPAKGEVAQAPANALMLKRLLSES